MNRKKGRSAKKAAKKTRKVAKKTTKVAKKTTKVAKKTTKVAKATKKKSAKKATAPTARKSARGSLTARRAEVLRFAQDDNGLPQRDSSSAPDDKGGKKRLGKRPAFNAKLDSANDPNWIAPVWNDDVLLGAHVSVAGGSHEAPRRARAIGATAMQIFTKMANRWAERACEEDECAAFRAALAETHVRATMAHDSYLINLASPDATLRRRSIESFVAELARCEALGLTYLVSHPGNYIDDRASGIQRNADGIAEALSRVPGKTILCMEITSGSGTSIGSSFEDLAALIEGIPQEHRDRMGVCIDTCHAYSAGYDFVNAYEDVWKRFDDVVGMSRLKCMHLNDSRTPFNSKRDRHEVIGEGSLGEAAFRSVMNDERLASIPKVIETPKGTDPTTMDAKMLTRLRSYISRR